MDRRGKSKLRGREERQTKWQKREAIREEMEAIWEEREAIWEEREDDLNLNLT